MKYRKPCESEDPMLMRVTALGLLIVLSLLVLAFPHPAGAADKLFPANLAKHYIALTTIPSSPADLYTANVWLLSIEFIPQSSSSPTCTVQDKAGNIVYNSVTLTANHSWRDSRDANAPLLMTGGITWSCSDTTVKAQLIVLY